MATYIEKLGTCAPDNLIANLNVKTIAQSVTIVAGAGALARGTVLGVNSAGKCAVLGSTTGLTPYGVLADAVDATTEAVAEVYVAGVFNKNALVVASGYTLSATDITSLRNGGIYVENAVK